MQGRHALELVFVNENTGDGTGMLVTVYIFYMLRNVYIAVVLLFDAGDRANLSHVIFNAFRYPVAVWVVVGARIEFQYYIFKIDSCRKL